MHLERGAAEFECIIESRLDLHIEPGVDAAVDKLHREIEHDEQWQYCETDEHRHHACFQLRSGYMIAIIAHQSCEIADEQREQDQDACNVDQQNIDVHAVELGGVFRRLTEHKERHERESDTDRAEQADGSSF